MGDGSPIPPWTEAAHPLPFPLFVAMCVILVIVVGLGFYASQKACPNPEDEE